jgi:hypothetical protein
MGHNFTFTIQTTTFQNSYQKYYPQFAHISDFTLAYSKSPHKNLQLLGLLSTGT